MPKSRLRGGKTAHRYQPIWIRPELHHKLKSVATKHNISMNVLVEKLLESQEPSNSDIFVI